MSRRRQRACSQANRTSHQPRGTKRWLKYAAWSNTSFATQTNVSSFSSSRRCCRRCGSFSKHLPSLFPRRAPSEVQRAGETRDGGAAEFIQLHGIWRRLQQPPGERHPLGPQVLVWHHTAAVARSVGFSPSVPSTFRLLLLVHDITTPADFCVCTDLLQLYYRLFSSSSKSINRVLVCRVIHTLVQGCCVQTEGFHGTLFSFFSSALLNARWPSCIILNCCKWV